MPLNHHYGDTKKQSDLQPEGRVVPCLSFSCDLSGRVMEVWPHFFFNTLGKVLVKLSVLAVRFGMILMKNLTPFFISRLYQFSF